MLLCWMDHSLYYPKFLFYNIKIQSILIRFLALAFDYTLQNYSGAAGVSQHFSPLHKYSPLYPSDAVEGQLLPGRGQLKLQLDVLPFQEGGPDRNLVLLDPAAIPRLLRGRIILPPPLEIR